MNSHHHLARSIYEKPRVCSCGETICNKPIPVKQGTDNDIQIWYCVLIQGHSSMCDNHKIARSKLFW